MKAGKALLLTSLLIISFNSYIFINYRLVGSRPSCPPCQMTNQLETTPPDIHCTVLDHRVPILKLPDLQRSPAAIRGISIARVPVYPDIVRQPETEYCIPKRLHFMWFYSEIPEKYIGHILGFVNNNPDYEINLWTDHISDFLLEKLDGVIIRDVDYNRYPITRKIVDMQHNVGAKADIIRIEILYQEGGTYVDCDGVSVKPFWNLLTHSFVVNNAEPWHTVLNGIYGFPKGSKFLLYMMEVANRFIPENLDMYVLDRTGPGFISAIVLQYNDSYINMIESRYLMFGSDVCIMYQTGDSTWWKSDGQS